MHVGDYAQVMRALHGPNVGLFAEAVRRDQERRKAEAAARVVWGPRKTALHRAMVDAFDAAGMGAAFLREAATDEERARRRAYEEARRAWSECPNEE